MKKQLTKRRSQHDIENEMCESLGVDIDDVQVQYEYTHPNGPAFDSLSPDDRAAYIKEIAATTAKVAAVIARAPSNGSDNMAEQDLAGMFATASFR